MEIVQFTLLGLVGILIFLMISDEMFAHWVYLFINLLIVNTKLFFWKLYLHPNNLLTKWMFERRLRESSKKYTNYD